MSLLCSERIGGARFERRATEEREAAGAAVDGGVPGSLLSEVVPLYTFALSKSKIALRKTRRSMWQTARDGRSLGQ